MHSLRSSPPDLPFREALNLLESGIGFYRGDLSLIFANVALKRLLREDRLLSAAVEQVLGELAWKCGLAGGEREVRSLVDRKAEGDGGRFRIRGGCVGMDLWATGGSLVVTVEAVTGDRLPEAEGVAQRFGLTPREAELAMLLAEGRSNDDIAAELFLSPHTVRNYTRRVLRKLRVSNRAQVGSKIRTLK